MVRVMVPIVSVTLRDGTVRYVKERPLSSEKVIDQILDFEDNGKKSAERIQTTQGWVRYSDIVLIEDEFHEQVTP